MSSPPPSTVDWDAAVTIFHPFHLCNRFFVFFFTGLALLPLPNRVMSLVSLIHKHCVHGPVLLDAGRANIRKAKGGKKPLDLSRGNAGTSGMP